MFSIMQVLGMCLPYGKVFSEAPVKYFFRAQITQIFLFLECWFGRDQRLQFNKDTSLKIFSAIEV